MIERLDIDLSNVEKIVLIGGKTRKTASKVFSELSEKPKYLINAGMYDTSSGLTVCDTIVDGKLLNGGNYTDKGFMWSDKNLEATTTGQARANDARYFLGGSPTLVWDGVVSIDGKGFTSSFLKTGKAIRLGMGITGEKIIFCFPKSTMTVTAFADVMKNAGCKYAINLDGGGSVSVMENKNGQLVALNKRTEDRANSTWLAIYTKDNKGNDDKMKTVFLNSGHGGADPGAVSGDMLEKNINLVTMLKCKEELERHNVKVVCSKVKDEDDKLVYVVREANSSGADIAVSFHANAGGGDGFEAFYYAGSASGKKLASLGEKYVKELGQNSRGLKSGNHLYFIKYTNAPAVLFESFFVDNEKDRTIGDTLLEQQAFGIAYAKAILEYFGISYQEEKTKIYRVQVGAFSQKENAENLVKDLKAKGYNAVIV